MTFTVALLLANCVVVGAGLSYYSGIDLRFEERLAYGAFFGLMTFTLLGWLTTRLTAFNASAVTTAAMLSLGVSLLGWYEGRERIIAEIVDLRDRVRQPLSAPGNPTVALFFLVPAWIVAIRILGLAYQLEDDGGIASGHLATFSDWQAHLDYTASFVYADNTGLDLPTAAGADLTYHVGINYFAALLVPAGASLTSALTISAGFCAVFFPMAMYLVGVRIFASRAVALLGTALFFLFGGLGWTRFLGDVSEQGLGVIWDLPITYTRDPDNGWWLENPVIGHLFPQRPTLIGFPIVMIVFALIWTAYKQRNRHAFFFAGVIVGLTPWFNLFAFGVPLAMVGAWMVMDVIAGRRAEEPEWRIDWLWFFAPVVILAAGVVAYMRPPGDLPPGQAADWWYMWVPEQLRAFNPEGFDSGPLGLGSLFSLDVIWFWIKNFGLFLPLLALAQFWKGAMPRTLMWASLPIWAWFVLPNFVKPHPWSGNNTHYFVFVLLLGVFPVASLLVRIGRRAGGDEALGRSTAALYGLGLLVATMTFAGALDVFAAADATTGRNGLMSGADVAVGEWARDHTDPDGVFVIASSHTHPIPALGGRTVVAGFNGWIFDLGIADWGTRNTDSRSILQAAPGHEELLDKYDVDYIVIGPMEQWPDWMANRTHWDARATVVYDFAGYRIYEVT